MSRWDRKRPRVRREKPDRLAPGLWAKGDSSRLTGPRSGLADFRLCFPEDCGVGLLGPVPFGCERCFYDGSTPLKKVG